MKKFVLLSVLIGQMIMAAVDVKTAETQLVSEQLSKSRPIIRGERHIVIVTCSYNNGLFYTWNIDSILNQKYSNYHVIYVDDCSEDKTFDLVQEYVQENGAEEKFVLIHNVERKKALANLYTAIHMCKPTDIVVILDGDDRFASDVVLQRINQAYADPAVWLTYGQFREHPSGEVGFCKAYPKDIIEKSGFRYYGPTPSHLRTFYAGLFHRIKIDDLMFQGQFFPVTYDLAIMFPLIEMARDHHLFIDDILVDYNSENPINDHKVGKSLQRKFDLIIRARTVYRPLDTLF